MKMENNLNKNKGPSGGDRKNKISISNKKVGIYEPIPKEFQNKKPKLNVSPNKYYTNTENNTSNKRNLSPFLPLNPKQIVRKISPQAQKNINTSKKIYNKKERNNSKKAVENKKNKDYSEIHSMRNFKIDNNLTNAPQIVDISANSNEKEPKNSIKKNKKIKIEMKKEIEIKFIPQLKNEKNEKIGNSEIKVKEDFNNEGNDLNNLLKENLNMANFLIERFQKYEKQYEVLNENYEILKNKYKNIENDNNNLNYEITNLKNIIKEKDFELINDKNELNSFNDQISKLKKENKELKDELCNKKIKYSELKNKIKKMKVLNNSDLTNSVKAMFNSLNSNVSENPSSELEQVKYSPQQLLEIAQEYNQLREYLNKIVNENEENGK